MRTSQQDVTLQFHVPHTLDIPLEAVLIQQCIIEQHSAVGHADITIIWKCNFGTNLFKKQSCIKTTADNN